jgi:hypothetical protein
MSLDEQVRRDNALRLKQLGILDHSELADRLRQGRRLESAERLFLADLVEGKIKRPAHRPPTASAALRKNYMAELFLWMKASRPDLQHKQIEYAVATHYGVSTDYVRRAVRDLNPEMRKYLERKVLSLVTGKWQ